jgi:hypothetical protein
MDEPAAPAWGLSLRSVSIVTLLGLLLYVLGHTYWTRFYGLFGLDFALVEPPLHRILRPAAQVFWVLYYTALQYLALTNLLHTSVQRELALAPRWVARSQFVLGCLSIAATIGTPFFYGPDMLVPLAFGLVAALLFWLARRFVLRDAKLMLSALGVTLLVIFSQMRAEQVAGEHRLPKVEVVTRGPHPVGPYEAYFVTADDRSWFLRDKQRRVLVVPRQTSEVRFLSATDR